jgi:hypothetical protein
MFARTRLIVTLYVIDYLVTERSHLIIRLVLYNCLLYILYLPLPLAWMLRTTPLPCYCPLKLKHTGWRLLIKKLLIQHIILASTKFPVTICVHVDKRVQKLPEQLHMSCSDHLCRRYKYQQRSQGNRCDLDNYCTGGWDRHMCMISNRCISIENILCLKAVVFCAWE